MNKAYFSIAVKQVDVVILFLENELFVSFEKE